MPYKIESKPHYQRVDIFGAATKWDAIQAIMELRQKDPCKAQADLWVIDEDVVVPLAEFGEVAATSTQELPADFQGAPTAIVVNNQLHYEMAKLYREQMNPAPFTIEIFQDLVAAEEWLAQYQTTGTPS